VPGEVPDGCSEIGPEHEQYFSMGQPIGCQLSSWFIFMFLGLGGRGVLCGNDTMTVRWGLKHYLSPFVALSTRPLGR
jgi:hypothetical protein